MAKAPTPTLWYVPLESYRSRYTYQLTDWNVEVFKKKKIKYQVVLPANEDTELNNGQIKTGQVLDAIGRSYFCLGQIQQLLKHLSHGTIKPHDIIFFEDMFHPGFEALPYFFAQNPGTRPRIYVRCLAQTIDPDDFVHTAHMSKWMRDFEKMVIKNVDGVFAASHEMLTYMTAAQWDVPVCVTGLPFGLDEVRSRVKKINPWKVRKNRVVFAARTDWEKQPAFFISLAEAVHRLDETVEFTIVSGKPLTFNSKEVEEQVNYARKAGIITVMEDLEKNAYYEVLNNSKVLFNCALQDWVSNTVSEADALGCNVLYPAYRSFPEVFDSCKDRLYIPWNLEDAQNKLIPLMKEPHPDMGQISGDQNQTIPYTVNRLFDVDGTTNPNRSTYWFNPMDPAKYRPHFNDTIY